MIILAWLLAEKAKEQQHWIWPVIMVAISILVIVRGVFAIRNKRVRLKYGIVKEGKTAVAWGIFFIVAGVAISIIAIVVFFMGPLV